MSTGRTPARRTVVPALILGALAAMVLAAGASGAPGDATATQVADIQSPGESVPASLFNAGGTLLFSASQTGTGNELWKSNGGPLGAGTELVANIESGAGGSGPTNFASINGTVFFSANDGTSMVPGDHGRELWKIEPPYTAPELVKDINDTDDGVSSSPEQFTNVNGTLFFVADNGVNGNELWKSVPPYDTGSTTLVKDINTTPDVSEDSDLEELAEINGTLYFSANNGVNGQELWKSVAPYGATDTTLVKDINTTPDVSANSFPAGFANRSGDVYFNADDGVNGQELWKSNGTGPGTTMVVDINPAVGGSNPDEITNVNGTLFFSADGPIEGRELWKSDGTGPGTAVVADINPTVSPSNPQEITNLNGTLFFRAGDGANGTELWKSNGGPLGAGTEMVADINPSGSSLPAGLTGVGGQVFFRATDGVNGIELWRSTGSGATLVRDINPLAAASSPDALTDVNGTLFFRATDGSTNRELWKATIEPAPPAQPNPPAEPIPKKTKKKCKKAKKKGKGKAAPAAAKKKKKCKKKRK